jgi:hypothetical protein
MSFDQMVFFLFPENYVWIFPALLSFASLLLHRWAKVKISKVEENRKLENIWKWLFLPFQTIVISVLNSLTITSVVLAASMGRTPISCPCYTIGEMCPNPCEPWGNPTWTRLGLVILLKWTVLFGLFLGAVISLTGRSRSRKIQTIFQAMTWLDIFLMTISTVIIIMRAKADGRL